MKKGDIITIIGLNGFGMCNRAEFKYYGEINGQQAVTENKKGARKKFVMPDINNLDKDRLSWIGTVPALIQGEIVRNGVRTMMGDCTIKIYGTVDEVKALVESNQNRNFSAYDAVFALDSDTDEPTPVYPDVETTSHPVIALRAKATA